MARPYKFFRTLTLFDLGAILSYFSLLTIWITTFQVWYDIDLKSKIFSLNVKTVYIFSDLNPIWPRGHLTQF